MSTVDFSSPPDLTPFIAKVDAQCVAGGGFGDVYKCWYHHHDDGSPKEVAVKALRFRFATDRDTSDKSVKMLRRELGIWRRLDHENVVPFLGIAYGFGMCDAISLVSLWMPNESLHHFLAKHDNDLGLEQRLQLLLDVANGLHYSQNPQCPLCLTKGQNNVLLDADYTARLADFGYASLVGNIPEALTYLQRSTARAGALRWVAPEQIESEEPFTRTPKSDIYSFGCVVFQVLSGKQPWSEIREDAAVVLRLAKGQKPRRPESRAIDDVRWNLIQDCWLAVEERPAAEVIISTIQQFFSHCPRSPPSSPPQVAQHPYTSQSTANAQIAGRIGMGGATSGYPTCASNLSLSSLLNPNLRGDTLTLELNQDDAMREWVRMCAGKPPGEMDRHASGRGKHLSPSDNWRSSELPAIDSLLVEDKTLKANEDRFRLEQQSQECDRWVPRPLFYSDRKGDPLNLTYGRLHAGDVPKYL